MNVLVDTSIWSEAFRRPVGPANEGLRRELQELISEQRIILLGPIRQELLSGIREHAHYRRLKDALAAFPDHGLVKEDYESAAELFNHCRAKGIQGSNTDFLICAVALRRPFEIYTADHDFQLFAKHIMLHFYRSRF